MRKLRIIGTSLAQDKKGASAVEYVLVVAGVAAVVTAVFGSGGSLEAALKSAFDTLGTKLTESIDPPGG